MAQPDPADVYLPEPNVLERRTVGYISRSAETESARRGASGRAETGDIARATRRAVILAAASGIVSGGLIGGAEVWIRRGVFDGLEGVGWGEQLPYWAGFFAFAGLVSAIEIAFLYWVSLRGVIRVAVRAGLAVGERGYPGLFGRGLARRALEFPDPRVQVYGIDPYAYVPGWRLAAENIAYKLKVGITSFILRIFLRRVAARMAVRGFVPLIAGPLYAAWNAWIVWRILQEARVRVAGPGVVDAVVGDLFGDARPPGEPARAAMLQGAAEMVRRAGQAHPNHVYLLSRLREELGNEGEIGADWDGQGDALRQLDENGRSEVLAILTLAAVIGSRTRRLQRDLLRDACAACRRGFSPRELKEFASRIREGQAVTAADALAVCPPGS